MIPVSLSPTPILVHAHGPGPTTEGLNLGSPIPEAQQNQNETQVPNPEDSNQTQQMTDEVPVAAAPPCRRPSVIMLGELSEDAQRLNSELVSVFLDCRRESVASVQSLAVPGAEDESNSNSNSVNSHISCPAPSIKHKSPPGGVKLQVFYLFYLFS